MQRARAKERRLLEKLIGRWIGVIWWSFNKAFKKCFVKPAVEDEQGSQDGKIPRLAGVGRYWRHEIDQYQR
jgi:hypothetical protein